MGTYKNDCNKKSIHFKIFLKPINVFVNMTFKSFIKKYFWFLVLQKRHLTFILSKFHVSVFTSFDSVASCGLSSTN